MSDYTTESYYSLLRVDKNSDNDTIKRSFRSLAKSHHPDRGGDPEIFKRISHAASVLLDASKRAKYDADEQKKHSSVVVHVKRIFVHVSLVEVYTGVKNKPVTIDLSSVCTSCTGSCLKPNRSRVECRRCAGQGLQFVKITFGSRSMMQPIGPCTPCNGTGLYLRQRDHCDTCNGHGRIDTIYKTCVSVPKGCSHMTRLFVPASETVSLPVRVEFYAHVLLGDEKWTRKGDHLYGQHTIPLLHALTGKPFTVKHLDGRPLTVELPRDGSVCKPGTVLKLPGQGLTDNSDMFINLEIEFPSTLPSAAQQIISRILPDPVTDQSVVCNTNQMVSATIHKL